MEELEQKKKSVSDQIDELARELTEITKEMTTFKIMDGNKKTIQRQEGQRLSGHLPIKELYFIHKSEEYRYDDVIAWTENEQLAGDIVKYLEIHNQRKVYDYRVEAFKNPLCLFSCCD